MTKLKPWYAKTGVVVGFVIANVLILGLVVYYALQ